jgi:pimeloyl-ACP methyl ester carboxylesterase
MDGTGTLFQPLLAALPPHAASRVIAYPADAALGYDALTEMVREQLPTKHPYVLLAESFSGPIAINLAACRAKRLAGLVLCNTFARSPLSIPQPIWRWLPQRLPMAAVPALLVERTLLGRYASPETRRSLHHAIAQVSPAVWAARLRTLLQVDVRRQLMHITVPCLYLKGEQDRLISATFCTEICEALTRVHLRPVAGPHALLQARAGECARYIAEFSATLPHHR